MKGAGKGGAGNFSGGQVNFGPKGDGKNKTYAPKGDCKVTGNKERKVPQKIEIAFKFK